MGVPHLTIATQCVYSLSKLTCTVLLWAVQVATKLMEEAKIREQEAQLAQARPEG
jgi:hypothetical protein